LFYSGKYQIIILAKLFAEIGRTILKSDLFEIFHAESFLLILQGIELSVSIYKILDGMQKQCFFEKAAGVALIVVAVLLL